MKQFIKIYYFALLFQLLNMSVILKLLRFFLMKSLKSPQFHREHLRKHAWKPLWEFLNFCLGNSAMDELSSGQMLQCEWKANPAWAGNTGVTSSATDRDRISTSSGTRDTNTKSTHCCSPQCTSSNTSSNPKHADLSCTQKTYSGTMLRTKFSINFRRNLMQQVSADTSS